MTVLCHLELCDTPIETLVGSFLVETFGLKTAWAWGQAQASWGTVEPSNTRSDLRPAHCTTLHNTCRNCECDIATSCVLSI